MLLTCVNVCVYAFQSPQLRPSATVYELAKNFSLEVSMFERLVRVNFPFVRLNYQVSFYTITLDDKSITMDNT